MRPARTASGRLPLVLGCTLAGLTILIGLAALAPSWGAVPFVASVLLPTLAPFLVLLGLVSLALALGTRRRRKGWPVVVAVVLAVVSLVVPSASLVGIARAAIDGHGQVNPLTALTPGSMAAAPDRTVRTGAGPSEVMDVYAPQGTTASSRTRILFAVHGGGWNTDATMPATLRWFANHGWVVVRPHYTLATSSAPTWNVAPENWPLRTPGSPSTGPSSAAMPATSPSLVTRPVAGSASIWPIRLPDATPPTPPWTRYRVLAPWWPSTPPLTWPRSSR